MPLLFYSPMETDEAFRHLPVKQRIVLHGQPCLDNAPWLFQSNYSVVEQDIDADST